MSRATRYLMPCAVVLALAACNSGTLSVGDDGGCTGSNCDDGGGCVGAECDDGGADPCAHVDCADGQECVDGRCQTADLCTGVVCSNPGEVCDPRDGLCHAGATDDDGDGYSIADGDCDDGNATIHPGAVEACDGVDQDCDRDVDEDFPDADGDGYDSCGYGVPSQADCDDTDPSRHPFRSEECNGVDDDCDGDVDEGIDRRPCVTDCGEGEERCEGGSWHCSAPDECECVPAGHSEEERCGNCGTRTRSCLDDFTWTDWSSCTGEGECAPGSSMDRACGDCGRQFRTCSGDCDWGAWEACEGEGECAPGSSGSCTTSCGSTGTRACDALCLYGSCEPPTETCNAVDDDCDGTCDEGCRHGIHRSYCPGPNDHTYTEDAAEAACCGCTVESSNFFYLSTVSVPGTAELWRCYNSAAGDTLLTRSASCEGASGFVRERSLGFIATASGCGTTPLYRLYLGSATDHFYTTSAGERDTAISHGWSSEGTTGHVWRSP